MDALAAPLVHVQRSDALWLIPAVPIVGAVVRRWIGRENLIAAIGPSLGALLITLSQVWALKSFDPDARHLLSPGPTPLRIGAMELGLGLAFDPLAAIMAIAIAVLVLCAQGYRAYSDEPAADAFDIAAGGALLAVVGDGFFGFLVGSAIASASVAFAVARPAIVERIGDAALVLGAALLFWTLGGSWGIQVGHEPTYTRHNPVPAVNQIDALESDDEIVGPSLSAVLIGAPASATPVPKTGLPDLSAKGYITIASPAGARVFLKGAMQPAATTPLIRHEVYAGRMDVEIERVGDDGRSVRRQRFRALDVPAGREVALVTMGPTLGFRNIREQLALTDGAHKPFVRDLVDPSVTGHRRIGSFDALTLLLVFIGIAAAVPLIGATTAGSALLVEALAPLCAVYLVARLAFLFVLSPTASSAIAIVFALIAALSAARAILDIRAPNVLARLLVAHLAIGATAAVIGAPAMGAMHAIAGVFSCGLAWILFESIGVRSLRRVSGVAESAPSTTRAARIAAIAIAGSPIPLLGAAFTRETVLARAFASELPFAKGIWALLAIAAVAMAVAMWRAWFAVFEGPRASDLEDPPPRFSLSMILAAGVVALLPAALSVSRVSAVSVGGERSIIEAFLDPYVDPGALIGADRAARFRELGRGADLGALALVIAGCIGAWFLLRRRMSEDDRPKLVARELPVVRVPLDLIARLDAMIFQLRRRGEP
jgi:NADH:ubiquinone oxidoreductase subunit 5 (subunit L)/multisubunit Na+/H+ antiporter MnhA subunit